MKSRDWYKDMQVFSVPEVQRTWLDDLCLFGREFVIGAMLFLSIAAIGLVALIFFGQ